MKASLKFLWEYSNFCVILMLVFIVFSHLIWGLLRSWRIWILNTLAIILWDFRYLLNLVFLQASSDTIPAISGKAVSILLGGCWSSGSWQGIHWHWERGGAHRLSEDEIPGCSTLPPSWRGLGESYSTSARVEIGSPFNLCWWRWGRAAAFSVVLAGVEWLLSNTFLSCEAVPILVLWLQKTGYFCLHLLAFPGCYLL